MAAYLRESPYDHGVTRKVKQAVSEIDKFGIRLGVFLKKYPIARIFVIFYMVAYFWTILFFFFFFNLFFNLGFYFKFLLHLWVGIVLFTYKPEVHEISFDQPPGVPVNRGHVVR